MRRTFERHVSQWRALEGPNREVFFPQTYLPGARGLSDFTHMDKLCVTIGGVPFNHLLYHFVLAFSRWEYASVVDGGRASRRSQWDCRNDMNVSHLRAKRAMKERGPSRFAMRHCSNTTGCRARATTGAWAASMAW
jgi:hypothetical protein